MDPFLEVLISIGIMGVAILVIRFTIKVRFIACLFAMAFAVALAVGYIYREELFTVLFIGELVKSLAGDFAYGFVYDFLCLGIYTAICTTLWCIYTFGAYWMSRDEKGDHYEVTQDGNTSKWSVFGWRSLCSIGVSAGLGFGISWCSCRYWDGFVFVLAGLQIIVVLIISCISIKDRFSDL